jgi:hypothetical protein
MGRDEVELLYGKARQTQDQASRWAICLQRQFAKRDISALGLNNGMEAAVKRFCR